MINRVFLIGNVARDPEQHTTQGGINKCSFTLAVNRRPNANGESTADFIPIVAWRQLADICGKYLTKGKKIAIVGHIQTRSYDAQDGSKRYVTEVIADELEFCDKKRGETSEGDSAENAAADNTPPALPAPDPDGLTPNDDDDGLPF